MLIELKRLPNTDEFKFRLKESLDAQEVQEIP